MLLTERQTEILNSIVEEYIDLAEPVSSKLLEKKWDFEICPATIRIEMQKLTEGGLIFKPHTSSGRVPTDKGYRYFVDELLEKDLFEDEVNIKIENLFTEEIENNINFIQSLTKNLAIVSSSLVLGYLPDEKILWKEGWEEILQEPEFQEKSIIHNFAEVINNFEEMMRNVELDSHISIFIGKENPFKKAKEFTTMITRCKFPNNKKGILAILGPKRMSYEKNINSLSVLVKMLEEL